METFPYVFLATLAAAACSSGQSTAHGGPSAAPARFLPNEGAATTLAALAAAGLGEQAAAGEDAAAPAALLERALQTTSATDHEDQLRSQRTSEPVGAVVLRLPPLLQAAAAQGA